MAPQTSLTDETGRVVFRGTQSPSGGSQPLVGCYLRDLAIPITTPASQPSTWNHLYDNIWDQNALAAIPAGLGLTFAFDGSDATITTTEAGVWSFWFGVVIAPDATWQGYYGDGIAANLIPVLNPGVGAPFAATHAPVYALPAGAFFAPALITLAGPIAPISGTVDLVIVRLG